MEYSELVLLVQKKMIKNPPDEDSIMDCLLEVEAEIKDYCCIPEVPEALKYTWRNMTIDLLKFFVESNTTPDDVLDAFDPSDVSTIKVGDTSISLGDKYRSNQRSRILQSHQPNLDTIVFNYRAQLNRHRRIW